MSFQNPDVYLSNACARTKQEGKKMADAQAGMHNCIADVVCACNLRVAVSHKSHCRLPLVNELYGMLSDKFSSLLTACFRS